MVNRAAFALSFCCLVTALGALQNVTVSAQIPEDTVCAPTGVDAYDQECLVVVACLNAAAACFPDCTAVNPGQCCNNIGSLANDFDCGIDNTCPGSPLGFCCDGLVVAAIIQQCETVGDCMNTPSSCSPFCGGTCPPNACPPACPPPGCPSPPLSCVPPAPGCPPICPPPPPTGCPPVCPPGCPPTCPPTCPAESILLPMVPTTQDADADGIPVVIIRYQTYTVNPDCSLSPTGAPTAVPVALPDYDDADPCVPIPAGTSCGTLPTGDSCAAVDGLTVELPSGVTTHDPDGDGWPDVGITHTAWTLHADCTLTTAMGTTMWCNCPAPPVEGPGAIICGGVPTPCLILVQTVPGTCGTLLDEDRDSIAIIYTCDTTYRCYSDGHCDETQAPISGSYGDPDDHDPCVPISIQALSPECHPNTQKNEAGDGKNNTFAKDGDFNLFQENWWGHWDFPWWLIILALLVIYYVHKRGQEKGRKKGQREGRPRGGRQ